MMWIRTPHVHNNSGHEWDEVKTRTFTKCINSPTNRFSLNRNDWNHHFYISSVFNMSASIQQKKKLCPCFSRQLQISLPWHPSPHSCYKAKTKQKNWVIPNLPLLHTLLSSSIAPLESSLSSSCRCKLCCAKWWWWWWWWLASARLWCKWCKWLLLAAVALKSRGLCGDGDRPPLFRSKCNALATLAAAPPPNISVIMKRDRDGSTAIDPRCIGTVMLKSLADAGTPALPFNDNRSLLVIVAVDFGLTPVECHCSTILVDFCFGYGLLLAATTNLRQNTKRRRKEAFSCESLCDFFFCGYEANPFEMNLNLWKQQWSNCRFPIHV